MTPRRLLWLTVLCAAPALGRAPVTLEDLQALAAQKAWAELLDRAEDLPPQARTGSWRALVTEAAIARVDAPDDPSPLRDALQDPFLASRKAHALGRRHGFLLQAPRFLARRDAVVLEDLERCLGLERERCLDTYLELTPGRAPSGALAAAHLVHKGHNAYVAMPLFAAAVGGKDTSACKDEALAGCVVAALGLPPADARAVSAKKVAFGPCEAALAPKLKAALVGASSFFLANTCQPLRARKALSELQEDLCADEGL